MTLTLNHIPEPLHKTMKEVAEHKGQNLDTLILHTLQQNFQPEQEDEGQLLERIRERREKMQVLLTEDQLFAAINEGRS